MPRLRRSSDFTSNEDSAPVMSSALEDEITSINSIYGDDTLSPAETPQICHLRLPSQPSTGLRLEFPSDYPDAPPSILGTHTVGDDVPKGFGSRLVDLTRAILAQVYRPGEPCIFDLIEEVGNAVEQERTSAQDDDTNSPKNDTEAPASDKNLPQASALAGLGPEPPWTLSATITEKKSVFLARSAPVTSPDQATSYIKHLVSTDKKVARATHNISAWRIRGEHDVAYQDCDDDGESAAGGRVLRLLQMMDCWDVVVVVTRWYGGIQLGPDRFRIINNVARDALVKGGFGKEAEKEESGGKKKGRGKR